MTNEELITICKGWRDRSIELTEKEIVDGAEDVEIYDAIIEALGTQPCEDTISKDNAIELIAGADETDGNEPVFSGKQIIKMLKSLPPVIPQPNVGKWIKAGEWSEGFGMGEVYGWFYECSECDKQVKGEYYECSYNYCPNCGAKMESEK